MAEPFIGEIRMVGFNFAPPAWAFCNGQLLPISQNTALFSLLGTTYGGDGRTTFALPDSRSRDPIHSGQGPGLSFRELGEMGGEEASALPEGKVEIPQSPTNPTVLDYAPAGQKVNIMGAVPGSQLYYLFERSLSRPFDG